MRGRIVLNLDLEVIFFSATRVLRKAWEEQTKRVRSQLQPEQQEMNDKD